MRKIHHAGKNTNKRFDERHWQTFVNGTWSFFVGLTATKFLGYVYKSHARVIHVSSSENYRYAHPANKVNLNICPSIEALRL